MNQKILLSTSTFETPRVVHGVFQDTGRTLEASFQDFTLEVGATATLFVRRPDGIKFETTATVDAANQKVTVSLQNALTQVGPNMATLKIQSGSVSSFPFIVECHPSAEYDMIPDDTVLTILVGVSGDQYVEQFKIAPGETWSQFESSTFNPVLENWSRMITQGPEGMRAFEAYYILDENSDYVNGSDVITGQTYTLSIE